MHKDQWIREQVISPEIGALKRSNSPYRRSLAPDAVATPLLRWLADAPKGAWYTARQVAIGVSDATGRYAYIRDVNLLLTEWSRVGVVEHQRFLSPAGRRRKHYRLRRDPA